MKKTIITLVAVLASTVSFADTYVHGYVRSNGTYVQPHMRSDQDSRRDNNYSSTGNYNPYNGNMGNVNPYAVQPYNPYRR